MTNFKQNYSAAGAGGSGGGAGAAGTVCFTGSGAFLDAGGAGGSEAGAGTYRRALLRGGVEGLDSSLLCDLRCLLDDCLGVESLELALLEFDLL